MKESFYFQTLPRRRKTPNFNVNIRSLQDELTPEGSFLQYVGSSPRAVVTPVGYGEGLQRLERNKHETQETVESSFNITSTGDEVPGGRTGMIFRKRRLSLSTGDRRKNLVTTSRTRVWNRDVRTSGPLRKRNVGVRQVSSVSQIPEYLLVRHHSLRLNF